VTPGLTGKSGATGGGMVHLTSTPLWRAVGFVVEAVRTARVIAEVDRGDARVGRQVGKR
jgi:hypothetical protein